MLRLSYSQLKMFDSCKRNYYYKYIMKLKEKDCETKWSDFGKAMHEVLEEYYSEKNKDWQDNITNKWKKYRLEGRMDFNSFRTHVINGISLGLSPTEVEEKMFLRVGQHQFVGYCDIVDEDEGLILDWKSGSYSADKAKDYKNQLICYAYLYYRKKKEFPKKLMLYFNKNAKKVPYKIHETYSDNETISHQGILDFEKYINDTGNEILRKKALNKTDQGWEQNLGSCFFCGYRHICHRDIKKLKYRIVIKNNYAFLEGDVTPMLKEGIDRSTKFDLPGKFFMQRQAQARAGGKRPNNFEDIGTMHIYNKIHSMFPIGLLAKVKTILKDYSEYNKATLDIEIIDLRDQEVQEYKSGCMPDKLYTDKTLRPYQIEAIEAFLHNEGMGYLEVATGGGKTLLTAELIRMLDTKTLWIIDRKELLHQTRKEFLDVLNVPIGIIGDGEYDEQDVTVATIQTLYSYLDKKDYSERIKKYLKNVNFAIIDEGHHGSSASYQAVFKELRNTKYRLGTTGTAKRDDGMEPIMFSLVGDIVYKVGAEDLIDKGYLIKPKAIFYEVPGNGRSRDYMEDYKLSVSENPHRNGRIIKIARILNTKKVLILVKLVKHGMLLEELIEGAKYIHGSLDGEKRTKYMEEFITGKNGVLIATVSIASEGLNIPDLTRIMNASGNKSDIKSIQIMGRILRKIEGKEEAVFIDFVDTGYHTEKHSRARIKSLKSEGHSVEIIKLDTKV